MLVAILLLLLLVILLGAGFTVHFLWILAAVVLVALIVSLVLRRGARL